MRQPQHLKTAGMAVIVLLCVLGPSISQATGIIDTVAGGGPENNVPALQVGLGNLRGLAVDSAGNGYIAATSINRVFKLDPSGTITTVAGNGAASFSGDGGPATSAGLRGPTGVAVDAAGNLFIADGSNLRIRKVAASTGTITTVAGNGSSGFCGDGGAATSACLRGPAGVAVDAAGNLFIADLGNLRIRKVAAGTGIITTVAGNGTFSSSGDGGLATSAGLRFPTGVAVDAAGNLFIAAQQSRRIRKVAVSTGIITTVAGNGTFGFSGDGGQATSAQLGNPTGVAVDAAGNLFIADTRNQRIRKVAASTGIITTVAGNGTSSFCGDGGAATSACLANPNGVAVDAAGHLFIADQGNNRIRKVAASTGTITTVAGNGTSSFCGDGGAATSACLANPNGVAVDAAGNLFIADLGNLRIRKVAANTGTITTVAGNGTRSSSGDGGLATSAGLRSPTGVAVDAAGHLFIADQQTRRVRKVEAGSGIITTVAGTAGIRPIGVAVDAAGNLFIADGRNHRIRKVEASTGIITTVAGTGLAGSSGDGGPATSARLRSPTGVAVDAAGNLFIADRRNHRIRKVDTSGTITTVAGNGTLGSSGDGGAATSAGLANPFGVAVDAAGHLFIADQSNNRIRKVAASTGIITTVAGTGAFNFCGDGGAATSACLANPTGVAVDAAGNLFIADQSNQRIRKVSVADTVVPMVTVPSPITVEAVDALGTPDTESSIQTFLGAATANDDVDGPLTPTNDAPTNFLLGITTVTFSATDTAGNTGSDTSTVTVQDTTRPVLNLLGDGTVTIEAGDGYTDAGATASDIVGGDLTGSIATTGLPVNTNLPGTFVITYNVLDAAKNAALQITRTVIVVNTPPTVTSLTLSKASINEHDTVTLDGTFADPTTIDSHMVTIAWGDGSVNSVVNLTVQRSFSVGHQYLDDVPTNTPMDTNTIQVTVTDSQGGIGGGSTSITVNNVAPVIPVDGIAGPVEPIALGGNALVTATFSDVGTLDTHTCTFSWDDGTADDVVALVGTGNTSCATPHTYAGPGVYQVTVTVDDDDTGTVSSTFEFVVVYDPDGGFVTGGGWIDSPAGAYVPDLSLTGKATFGFVSKYKKGATTPTGQTEFQFQVANLNYHSSSYDWLVIAGHKAMYKGTGTINGMGNYGFLLSAIDAKLTPSTEIDLFRMKIYDKDDGDEVVYDNQILALEDANPTMAISKGAIVIHKGKK